MKAWELLDKGFSYDVVAVFGSQSTGKSKALRSRLRQILLLTSISTLGTLLNRLFGTEFAVMGDNDRRQTTKGL